MRIQNFINNDTLNTSNPALEASLVKISLEANFVANMIQTFREVIPSFSASIRQAGLKLSAMTKNYTDASDRKDHIERSRIMKLTKDLDFLLFADRYVMVPEDFKGNLLEYSILLNTVSNKVFNSQNQAMAEYTNMLSSFLSNKDDKTSMKDHTDFYKRIRKEREDYAKQIAVYFPKATGKSRQPLRNVMTRFTELADLFIQVETLNASHSKTHLTNVQTSVTHCADMLDMVITGVKEDTIKNVSPEATNNIATGAYELGRYVEFLSVIYFQALTLTATLNNIIDDVKESTTAMA